jgi:PKD repeat protein
LGSDTSTATVTISLPPAPTVSGATICAGQTASLAGTATGSIVWYNAGGQPIDTTATFVTPTLTSTTTYYAENAIFFPSQNIGPLNGTIGTGGYHNTGFTGAQNFTANKALTILSAWLDAGSAGTRTVYLWNGSNGTGTIVDSAVLNVPAGAQRVALNIEVPGPGNYSLGGTTINLYRNSAGATYPYTIAGLLTITGSSAATPSWYYLYDWEVQEAACRSAQVPVTVNVSGAAFTQAANGLDVQFTDISNAATSWSWNFGDGNTSTAQNPLHTYAAAGTYSVVLIVNGNTACPYTLTVTVTASGVAQIDNAFQAELTPNPSTTQTTLRFNSALKADALVQIIAVDGRILRETIVAAGETTKELDLKGLAPAMYLVRLNNGVATQTLKLTVK